MLNIGDVKDNLTGMLHGQDVDTIEGINVLFERTANTLLSHISPLETVRTTALSSTIHDDIYNYSLPSDFYDIIDLYPQDDRTAEDMVTRRYAKPFDLKKAFKEKQISIEGSEGSKNIRINYRSRQGKTLHDMNSVTDNGTWSAVTGASGVVADDIFKVSGSASIKFSFTATGGGIKNTTMDAVDLTDYDEVADIFVHVFLSSTDLTSIACRFGNDLTSNYWTPTVQTIQADGTALKVGWNLIKFAWAGSIESGSVNPATIDSFQLTINGTTAMTVRVDNIIFSIGRNFDIKYYSKFLFRSSAGVFKTRPSDDSDIVNLDSDAIQCWMLENLIACGQQAELEVSAEDINWAQQQLYGQDLRDKNGLYAKYRKRFPSLAMRPISSYGAAPARGRW